MAARQALRQAATAPPPAPAAEGDVRSGAAPPPELALRYGNTGGLDTGGEVKTAEEVLGTPQPPLVPMSAGSGGLAGALPGLTGVSRAGAQLREAAAAVGAVLAPRRFSLLSAIIFIAVVMVGVRVSDILVAFNGTTEAFRPTAGPPVAVAQVADDGNGAAGTGSPEVESPGNGSPGAGSPGSPGDGGFGGVSLDTLLDRIDREGLSALDQQLFDEISTRRRALRDRERALGDREVQIQVAEQRYREKLAELEQTRVAINAKLAELNAVADEELLRLVKVYESMRPADAAAIFNGLEMDVLLDLVQNMREAKSAPILAGMDADRARQVTAELATRGLIPELAEN